MGKLALTWQYNGCASFDEIVKWCEEHIGTLLYSYKFETIFFYTEADYTMFLLRWS